MIFNLQKLTSKEGPIVYMTMGLLFGKKMKRQLVVILLLTAVMACKSEPDPNQDLASFSFDLTCRGTGLTKASAYQPEDDRMSQIVIMNDSTIGAQYDEYTERFNRTMPEEWFPQIVAGTFVYDAVELVLCVHRTAVERLDIPCDFEDGYSINVHNATYEMTLRSAQTAAIIAQETVTSEGHCPALFSIFTEGEKEQDQFADIEDVQIQAFIEPYVSK